MTNTRTMYVTYLTDPHLYPNAAFSGPGIGETEEEARRNATYHANQAPYVVTVPASRAPRWALEQATSDGKPAQFWRYA